MVEIGNEVSNSFWKFKFPEDDQISPDCTSYVSLKGIFEELNLSVF